MSKPKIIVGLSGGVDSSLTAWLLQQQGYLVEGFFMKNWEHHSPNCPATDDLIDVMKICDKLNIELHADNFSKEYEQRVFKHFLKEYEQGRTPNPDILCNREIKFDVLLKKAQELGAEKIATGHYAGIEKQKHQPTHTPQYQLSCGIDKKKDQSYFLYALNQSQLANSFFPLHHWYKVDVRKKAQQLNLITHNKKDSTGICFIGQDNFRAFLSEYLPIKKGDIINEKGQMIGEHQGTAFYTLGQRKGLSIGGIKNALEMPWYVAEKKPLTNQLIVVQGLDHPLLNHKYCIAKELNWINNPPQMGEKLTARIRHLQALQCVTVETISEQQITVSFDKKQFAIAPGQSLVLYQNHICLGGGIIDSRN